MQVQLCLEICNLEVAHFIQYRPSSLTWPMPAEFVVTEVKRDRQWFQESLPIFWNVYQEIQNAREVARATRFIPYEPSPVVPRVKRARSSPKPCIIVDDLYGAFSPPPPPQPTCTENSATCLFETVECMFGTAVPRQQPQNQCMFQAAVKPQPTCMFA